MAAANEVMIEEVIDLHGGSRISLRPVAKEARRRDVHLGWFSDEEVHVVSPDRDARPRAHIDAPRLSGYAPEAVTAALESTLWTLQARGHGHLDREHDTYVFHGEHALLGNLRWSAATAVSLLLDVREEGTSTRALYRVDDDLWLCEDVLVVGLHEFTFRSPERAAAWLLAEIDRETWADRTEPASVGRQLDELRPHPDALAEVATVAATVYAADASSAAPDETAAGRSFTAYAGPDGLWLLAGWQDDSGQGEVRLQRVGAQDFGEACASFLAGEPTVRPR